jgi:hypothetical protein
MKLNNSDLFCLLVSSVRYALGRSSYVVPQTIEILLRSALSLSVQQINVICRSIDMDLQFYGEEKPISYKSEWNEASSRLKELQVNGSQDGGDWT